MNNQLYKIKNKISKLLPYLKEKFKVESLGIFGSYVRQDQKPSSDLDLLVTFSDTPTLFQFIELETQLSEKLGIKVDLVMKSDLKPRIKDHILNEVVTLI